MNDPLKVTYVMISFMVFLVLISFELHEHQETVLTVVKIWGTAILTFWLTEARHNRKVKEQEEDVHKVDHFINPPNSV